MSILLENSVEMPIHKKKKSIVIEIGFNLNSRYHSFRNRGTNIKDTSTLNMKTLGASTKDISASTIIDPCGIKAKGTRIIQAIIRTCKLMSAM